MENRKRNIQIKFRVTEEERTLIEEKMKQVPTSNMEAYLRKMAIDGYIIQIDHSDIKKMTAELQKIGVNVNQIAWRANATGNVYQEDIEEIKGAFKEIWRLQRLSLLKGHKKILLFLCYHLNRKESIVGHQNGGQVFHPAPMNIVFNLQNS